MGEGAASHNLASILNNKLGKKNIKIEFETTVRKDIKLLLANASKTKSDNRGFPDLIVTYKNYNKLIIVCECKKDIKNHYSDKDDSLNTFNPKKYASSGVIHYMNEIFYKSKNGLDIIGIAYSGIDEKNYKIDIFGINKRFNNVHTKNIIILPKNIDEAIGYLYSIHSLDSNVEKMVYNQSVVYKLSIKKFLQIQFEHCPFQRNVNQNRVEEIAKFHEKEYNEQDKTISPLGTILIGFLNRGYYIIDGQHRIGAYQLLDNKYVQDFTIIIQIKNYDSLQEMGIDFILHNKSVSLNTLESEIADEIIGLPKFKKMKPYIQKNPSLSYKQLVSKIVNKVCFEYKEICGPMFSDSKRCYRPHININIMIELIGELVTKKKSYYNLNENDMYITIKSKITQVNNHMKNSEYKNSKKRLEKNRYEKCAKYNMFLGLSGNYKWVYHIKL